MKQPTAALLTSVDSANAPSFSPTKILVAEDDSISRRMLRKCLEDLGHEVVTAVDGKDAWDQFCEHQPRLLVTDRYMPLMDGMELCSRVRAEADHYTFVLMLTSATEQDALVQGFAAGVDDFMPKPFDRVELEWRIRSGLRLVDLQQTLEQRLAALEETRASLEHANEEMEASLVAAAKIQRSLLPTQAPDVSGGAAAWIYKPSGHLGGDSLNVFALSPTTIGFFIVDVCGHGLPASLLAVAMHRVLSPVSGHGLLGTDDPVDLFSDPGRVLTEVNNRFPMKIEDGEYCTAVYGVLDASTGELRIASAGHPGPIVAPANGDTWQLTTQSFPIGFDSTVSYEAERIALQPGDRVLAFSDGIIEARGSQPEMFGVDRVIQHLLLQKDRDLSEVLSRLAEKQFAWEHGQEDDLSMVLLEFEGASQMQRQMADDLRTTT